jgi:hypothetical protein
MVALSLRYTIRKLREARAGRESSSEKYSDEEAGKLEEVIGELVNIKNKLDRLAGWEREPVGGYG